MTPETWANCSIQVEKARERYGSERDYSCIGSDTRRQDVWDGIREEQSQHKTAYY